MKLVIRQKAADDLDEIYDWIARESPVSARRIVRKILSRIGGILLPELVEIGRPGRRKSTRELVEWPYIIVYKADMRREVVTILAIFHGAQDK